MHVRAHTPELIHTNTPGDESRFISYSGSQSNTGRKGWTPPYSKYSIAFSSIIIISFGKTI